VPLRDASLGLLILRGVARRFAFERAGETHTLEGCLEGEQGGASLDARRMSYRTRAPNNCAARTPAIPPGKPTPILFSVARPSAASCWAAPGSCMSMFSEPASIQPRPAATLMSRWSGGRRPPAVRNPPPVFDDVFAALTSPAPLISTRVSLRLGPSLTFDDRFAAASPQGDAPTPVPPDRQVAALAPPQADRQVAQLVRLPAPRPADARCG